jgi:WD40 repeat protein
MAVAWSIDGKLLASASCDKTVRLWDGDSGKELKHFLGHSYMIAACEFAPNGKTIVSASWDEKINIWDVSSGTCQARPSLGIVVVY